MAVSDEDKIFDALAIRDTVNHDSGEAVSGEFQAKTIWIENGLNQNVTFQLQGARNSVWINIGSTFVQNANINGYKTVTDYFPKYRLQAICGTTPTTGVLDTWILKALG